MTLEALPKKPFKYNCKDCGYGTNRKWSFDYHINRKKPCKPKENESMVGGIRPKSNETVTPSNENVTLGNSNVTLRNSNATFGSSNVQVLDRPSMKSLTCQTCGVVFLNRQAKYRHVKKAQCKPLDDSKTDENDKLKAEIDELKRTISLQANNQVINNTYNICLLYTSDAADE